MGRGTAGGLALASVVLLLSLGALPSEAGPFNVTTMLNAYPTYSQFNQLLTSSGVADEVNQRSSITVLVVSNPVLTAFLALYPNAGAGQLSDLLRYQVLLQYLDIPLLKTITAGNPSTVTTLFQTTGRAAGNAGSVNVYNDGTANQVGLPDPTSPPNATVVTNVTQIPYNISILELDHVLAYEGFGAPATAGANLTAILEGGQTFTQLISLLQSTGVGAVFASLESGTGITIFAPTDNAFNALPPGSLAAATPAQKKLILEYHALTAYYTLGSLMTVNNPAAPTVATTTGGAGTYLLNVSSVPGGAVTLNSGISSASISSTLYDTPPTVVFAINAILLPKEIFAVAPAPAPSLTPVPAPSPTNATVPVPTPSPLSPSPTPAPSPLTPSPTPTPTPTPALTPSPTPTPVPAISPGPPAPPPTTTGEPTGAPDNSPGGSGGSGGSGATSLSTSVVGLVVLAGVSSCFAML